MQISELNCEIKFIKIRKKNKYMDNKLVYGKKIEYVQLRENFWLILFVSLKWWVIKNFEGTNIYMIINT